MFTGLGHLSWLQLDALRQLDVRPILAAQSIASVRLRSSSFR
jgi:hypothetical protein